MNVSVVITTHNSSGTISCALKSLADQTHRPYEVLIVDDASEDFEEVSAQCHSFGLGSGIPIVARTHATKQNASCSRNLGLKNAVGDLICFLDGDDKFYPNKLQELVAAAAVHGPRCAFVNHFREVAGSRSIRTHFQLPSVPASEIDEYMFVRGRLVQTSCIAIPRSIAEEVQFDEGLQRFQDYAFLLRLKKSGISLVGYGSGPLSVWHRAENYQIKAARSGEGAGLVSFFLSHYAPHMSPAARMGFKVRHLAGPVRNSKAMWLYCMSRLAVGEPCNFLRLVVSKALVRWS